MTKPDFTEDRIYNDFPKMLGFIYGDIVGPTWACRVHLGFVQTKGDEFNKAVQALPAPRQALGPCQQLREWCRPRQRATHASCW